MPFAKYASEGHYSGDSGDTSDTSSHYSGDSGSTQ